MKKSFLERGFVESSEFIDKKEVKQIKLIYEKNLKRSYRLSPSEK